MRWIYPKLKATQVESVRAHLVGDVRRRADQANITELERRLEAGGLVAVHALIGHPKLHRIQREAALWHIAETLAAELSPKPQPSSRRRRRRGEPKPIPHRARASPRELSTIARLARQLGRRIESAGFDGDILAVVAEHYEKMADLRRETRALETELREMRGPWPGAKEKPTTRLAWRLENVVGPVATFQGIPDPPRLQLIVEVVSAMLEPIDGNQLRQRLLSHKRSDRPSRLAGRTL